MSIREPQAERSRRRTGGHTRNKLHAGVLNIRMRNNYPLGRTLPGIFENFSKKSQCRKLSHSTKNCRTVPKIPQSKSLNIEPNYTLSLYIEPNYTLSLYIETAFGSPLPIFIHASVS